MRREVILFVAGLEHHRATRVRVRLADVVRVQNQMPSRAVTRCLRTRIGALIAWVGPPLTDMAGRRAVLNRLDV